MTTRYRTELYEELEKQAFVGNAVRRGASVLGSKSRQLGTAIADGGALRTGLVGAGVGATGGAISGAASEDGSAVGGALRGALIGGALGAGGGAVARSAQNAKLLNPALTNAQALGQVGKNVGQGLKDFGIRQLHGVTGLKEDAVRDSIRRRAAKSRQIHKARLKRDLAKATPENRDRIIADYEKIRATARSNYERDMAALDSGITSLPGIAKGLVRDPKATAKAMWDRSTGGTRTGAAMTLGFPVALTAPELLKGDESATGGKGIGQKLVNAGTAVGAGVATGGLGFIPGMIGWTALEGVGNAPFNIAKKRTAASAANAAAPSQVPISGRPNPASRVV